MKRTLMITDTQRNVFLIAWSLRKGKLVQLLVSAAPVITNERIVDLKSCSYVPTTVDDRIMDLDSSAFVADSSPENCPNQEQIPRDELHRFVNNLHHKPRTRDLAFHYLIEICVFGVHGQKISKRDNCAVACVISEGHPSSGCRF
ncbi:hypothetical protein NC652_030913 [Populus alba x Populus x berolinensis]|nr:hypothetical protein NC652_030913 [Populus alba x Populus x berolinensis]